jgi:hypothetical protein
MFQALLQIPAEIPFETIKRSTPADWYGLLLFFTGLLSLIVLLHRNPNVLVSLFTRLLKNDSDKLYFSAPAIDSLDRIFLSVIYLCSTLLSIHFFLENRFDNSLRWLLYLTPLAAILYFSLPFMFIARVVGFTKFSWYLLKKQMPIVFLFGLILLPIGGLLFLDIQSTIYIQVLILILFSLFLVWLHFRVVSALIVEGFPLYFIFMYFCSLEILPLIFSWVWLSRT